MHLQDIPRSENTPIQNLRLRGAVVSNPPPAFSAQVLPINLPMHPPINHVAD